MVVTVPVMRAVQMPRDEVVHVIAVRDGLMAAVCAVNVTLVVPSTAVRRRAGGGVHRSDFENALIHVPVVGVVEVAVVQIVDVVAVANGGMAAGWAVVVLVVRVGTVSHDFFCFPLGDGLTTCGSLACSSAARISSRT